MSDLFNTMEGESRPPLEDFPGGSSHLFVLELPGDSDEQGALELLREWGLGLCQAAFRGPFGYLNLSEFTAIPEKTSSGAAWWVFADLPGPWELGLEGLASSVWSGLAPGCFVQMLRRPGSHTARVKKLIGSVEVEDRVTSASLGIPQRGSQPARSDGPVQFFTDDLIPIWADAGVWISADLRKDYFGFASTLGRTGVGDCLVAHCFHMDGEALCTTIKRVPVSANKWGMDLRAMLAKYVSRDATVLPVVGLKSGGIKSGDQLHDEILSVLRGEKAAAVRKPPRSRGRAQVVGRSQDHG